MNKLKKIFDGFDDCLMIVMVYKWGASSIIKKSDLLYFRQQRFRDTGEAYRYLRSVIMQYYKSSLEAIIFAKRGKEKFCVVVHHGGYMDDVDINFGKIEFSSDRVSADEL